MNKTEIGHRVRAFRKKRGLTMRELADRTGLSQGQISRLENGRQGLRSDTLVRLAKALSVQPYRLYLPEAEERVGGAAPPVADRLADALRRPDFVATVEEMAKAYHESPERFHAIESVVRIILEGAGDS